MWTEEAEGGDDDQKEIDAFHGSAGSMGLAIDAVVAENQQGTSLV
jgi:hypothetical protein